MPKYLYHATPKLHAASIAKNGLEPRSAGAWEKGFICEPYALAGARDITEFGGWRAYLATATRETP